MKLHLALLFLFGATLSHAEDPAWHFHTGATYTWECRAQSTYTQQRTFKDGITRTVASPDTCTLTLKATVTAVGDDGCARFSFEVERVVLDAVWHDTGARAKWDSQADKDVVPGFERYAVMAGHKFTALIGGDGEIRELKGSAWPKICNLPRKPLASKGEENAASTMRDPDPARTWLDMIFGGTPRAGKSWVVSFNLPAAENLSGAPAEPARSGGEDCAVVRLETPKEGPDAKPLGKRRHGRSWFATAAGCLVRSEMEGLEDSVCFRPGTDQAIRWTAELKAKTAAPGK